MLRFSLGWCPDNWHLLRERIRVDELGTDPHTPCSTASGSDVKRIPPDAVDVYWMEAEIKSTTSSYLYKLFSIFWS